MYKGPVINLIGSSTSSHHESSSDSSDNHEHWVAGTLLILVGCVAWACFYVLQSISLKKYPAELSLSSLICASGTLQSAAAALAVEHHASAWAVGWDSSLFAPLYTYASCVSEEIQNNVVVLVDYQVIDDANPQHPSAISALNGNVKGCGYFEWVDSSSFEVAMEEVQWSCIVKDLVKALEKKEDDIRYLRYILGVAIIFCVIFGFGLGCCCCVKDKNY
ncbi:hypothetical protein Q3G72_001600 [Acer saccharum]|nr:hypothetical protein Q3G72_001600 [Acer saccharum]